MTFPFLLYKLSSNPKSESFFSHLIIFHLYLHNPIKFSSLYLANLLLLICDFRSYLLPYVSLFSASAKFASLEFAAFLRVDTVNVTCAGISIILNLLTHALAIQNILSVDAVLQQDIIIKW